MPQENGQTEVSHEIENTPTGELALTERHWHQRGACPESYSM